MVTQGQILEAKNNRRKNRFVYLFGFPIILFQLFAFTLLKSGCNVDFSITISIFSSALISYWRYWTFGGWYLGKKSREGIKWIIRFLARKAKDRRTYQYSLRSLLLLMLLVAIASSWVAVKMQRARWQKEAVESWIKLGGIVYYDYQYDSKNNLTQGAIQPDSAWLRNVLGDDYFRNVTFVSFYNNQKVTNADLENLKGLNHIIVLQLDSTKITDAGLEYLEGLSRLQQLYLYNTQITDTGLEHLKGLKRLQRLYLGKTQVTDAGVENLRKAIPNLIISR